MRTWETATAAQQGVLRNNRRWVLILMAMRLPWQAGSLPDCPAPHFAQNKSASLRDIGDGVLCLEFHSKMNTIDAEIIAMLGESVDREGIKAQLRNGVLVLKLPKAERARARRITVEAS